MRMPCTVNRFHAVIDLKYKIISVGVLVINFGQNFVMCEQGLKCSFVFCALCSSRFDSWLMFILSLFRPHKIQQ